MFQNHKLSFRLVLALIFLIPLFFIPGGALSLDIAKSALFVVGASLIALVYMYELWREGKLTLPKTYLLWGALALPVIYFLSAILATPSSLSLFGYGFEAGTFGFMLIGSSLLLLVALIFSDVTRNLQALSAVFLSFAILSLFVIIKIFAGGENLVLGNFLGNMGNPLGNWTDLGMSFGLLAVLSSLAVGMLPTRGIAKVLLYGAFILGTGLMVVVGFSTAYIFALIAAILLVSYFSRIEKKHSDGGEKSFFSKTTFLPIVLGIVSLLMVVNPNISEDKPLSSYVSDKFGVNNAEVRPSFGATLSISKAVLSKEGLLGSGPNTFSRDWLIYKPTNINTTPFWATTFPFGAGFLPTQIATTGIMGSALWLVFFVLLVVLSVKALTKLPQPRAERFTLLATMLGSLFLWGATFLYAPSGPMILLAFLFTGLFVASSANAGVIPTSTWEIKSKVQGRVAACLIMALIALGAIYLGWTSFDKTVSAYHFNKAVMLSNTANTPLNDIEASLIKAVNTAPTDVYFVALSRLNFARAQAVANSATGTPEENRKVFEDSIARSIEAARLAVSSNPAGFENWVALGNTYASLVPAPLSVEGAYENAAFAYNEASKRNPANPEIPLLLAQLELVRNNVENAKTFIRQAIVLKQDYADAYLMLAQLEVAAGNTAEAISSAENLAVLVPNNPGIHFELGLLKYSLKNFAGAETSFRRAIELTPDYANAKYYLGLTLAQQGRFTEAEAELTDLLRTNPDNAELKAAIEAVKAKKIPGPTQQKATQAGTR